MVAGHRIVAWYRETRHCVMLCSTNHVKADDLCTANAANSSFHFILIWLSATFHVSHLPFSLFLTCLFWCIYHDSNHMSLLSCCSMTGWSPTKFTTNPSKGVSKRYESTPGPFSNIIRRKKGGFLTRIDHAQRQLFNVAKKLDKLQFRRYSLINSK